MNGKPTDHSALAGLTANDRFKRSSRETALFGLLAAVAVHVALFLVFPPLAIADMSPPIERELALVLPIEAELPPPPEQIRRPATPVIGDVSLDESATISPTDFDRFVPPVPTPPRLPSERSRVRFVPYDTPPALRNVAEIRVVLEREYPRGLRAAGIEGTVELWLFVTEAGEVDRAEVRESSGNAGLDAAALAVAARMRFTPALNRDRATAVWVRQAVTFRVRQAD